MMPTIRNCLLETDPRSALVETVVRSELGRISDILCLKDSEDALNSFELLLMDVEKLEGGHLGLYDVKAGKWMHLACGDPRPVVGGPTLGLRLVDGSIAGAVRHEYGHHLWYRRYCIRRTWNEVYQAKGLGHWFRQNISLYAGSNREEAWCEVFSAYCVGLEMPDGMNDIVANILMTCGG